MGRCVDGVWDVCLSSCMRVWDVHLSSSEAVTSTIPRARPRVHWRQAASRQALLPLRQGAPGDLHSLGTGVDPTITAGSRVLLEALRARETPRTSLRCGRAEVASGGSLGQGVSLLEEIDLEAAVDLNSVGAVLRSASEQQCSTRDCVD